MLGTDGPRGRLTCSLILVMGVQVQVDVPQQESKHLATCQENKAGKLSPLRAALETGRW